MDQENPRQKLFSPAVLIGGVIFSGLLLLPVAFFMFVNRPSRSPVGKVTAAITIIPMPTATSTPHPIPEEQLPTSISDDNTASKSFKIGAFVRVFGTEGAGLRLRENPSLDADPLYLGIEDEIFKIENGPQDADGYTWWFLVAPFDPDRNGWAVSNYLESVQEP